MPGFDRTGPLGMGPMTGRAAGYCADVDDPEQSRWLPGRGLGQRWGAGWQRGPGLGRGWGGGYPGRGLRNLGRGRGYPGYWGRGRGRWAWGPGYPLGAGSATDVSAGETELQALMLEARRLEAALESISKRLAEIEE